MKIYKDQNNNLWAYEKDGSQDHLIPVDFVQITAEEAEALRSVYAPTYAEKRANEYPSFADQFDLLYHGGIDAWKAAIQVVKDKYPKA